MKKEKNVLIEHKIKVFLKSGNILEYTTYMNEGDYISSLDIVKGYRKYLKERKPLSLVSEIIKKLPNGKYAYNKVIVLDYADVESVIVDK